MMDRSASLKLSMRCECWVPSAASSSLVPVEGSPCLLRATSGLWGPDMAGPGRKHTSEQASVLLGATLLASAATLGRWVPEGRTPFRRRLSAGWKDHSATGPLPGGPCISSLRKSTTSLRSTAIWEPHSVPASPPEMGETRESTWTHGRHSTRCVTSLKPLTPTPDRCTVRRLHPKCGMFSHPGTHQARAYSASVIRRAWVRSGWYGRH